MGNAAAACHPCADHSCGIGIAIRHILRSTGMACLLAAAAVGSVVHAQGDDLASERAAIADSVAASADDAATAATTDTLALAAPGISPRPMSVHIHLPPGYARDATTRYPVLYVNDGQDWDAVGVDATLAQLYRDGAIRPVIVVAIDMPPDRMGAYGLSDPGAHRSLVANTRYGPVGAIADAYSRWVVEQLVPHVDAHYRTRPDPADRTVLGWSLGALNAFNLGWQYPKVFGRVGAFSPSFWVSSERQDATASLRTRLAQRMVDRSGKRVGARFWFAIGDSEDTDDRDGDGLNDAVDDLRDLILGYRAGDGFRTRGLADLGYTTDMAAAEHAPRDAEVAYFLLRNGHHNQDAWKQMLPPFLAWAFGKAHPDHSTDPGGPPETPSSSLRTRKRFSTAPAGKPGVSASKPLGPRVRGGDVISD